MKKHAFIVAALLVTGSVGDAVHAQQRAPAPAGAAPGPLAAASSAPPTETPASTPDPAEVRGEVGESCRARSDCADGLKCVANTCRDQFEGTTCESRRDCGPRLGCFKNVCAASADAASESGSGRDDGARSDASADEDDASEEPARVKGKGKKRRASSSSSHQGLIAGGAVLTAVGWGSVLVGIPVIVLGALGAGNDDDYLKAGGVAVGVGATLGITGSIMLGVGVRQRRESRYSPRDEVGFVAPAEVAPPGLTVTFAFD
mgnify:CR=1 FL=1